MDRAECYFRAHGGKTVLIGRFAPASCAPRPRSSPAPSKMPHPRFLAFNTPAIFVWAVLYATAGYLFGEYRDELLAATRAAGPALLGVIALCAYRGRKLAGERGAAEPALDSENTAEKGR